MATDDNKKPKKNDEDVIKKARERFELAVAAETDIRVEALDDLRFVKGEQWPDEIKRQRDLDNRPCLTINRLPQFVRQVTNEQRQNRPAIKVNPVDDNADVETAKILQGLIRHIEYDSNAEIAYDTASDYQCRIGFGYFRIITDYCDPMSFDQDIKIKRIKNPFTVYLDPGSSEPDGSDGNWGFIFDELSKDKYIAQYPDSELSQMEDWKSLGDGTANWVTLDGCIVAEYFEKVFKPITVCLMNDGSTVKKDELPKELPQGIQIVDQRVSLEASVVWRKINGIEVLEETEWPGAYIPIVPVFGDEIIIEGERTLEGVIRHAKDSQRMYNYWATAETETIALAPKAPFIGAEGQFKGHEDKWKTANIKNHPYLEYVPKALNGSPMPAPQRQTYEPPVQAITGARMQSAEDLKATTGIYDASLGNRSNESSGRAIEGRVKQAENSNFHLIDNFTRSLRHAGRIILEAIPKVYNAPRVVRIVHEDGEQEQVVINQMFQKGNKSIQYDLSAGKYDVTVSTGPSYQTKRQEAVSSMMSLVQAYPQMVQICGDIMVKEMDWNGAQEIAERLKKMLPPQLQDPKDGQDPIPPQAQQQMAQMSQMIKQLSGEVTQQAEIINAKRLELESKERIALMQAENELVLQQMKTDMAHSQTAFKLEVADIHKRLDLVNNNVPISSETGSAQAQPGPQQPTSGSPLGAPSGQPMGV